MKNKMKNYTYVIWICVLCVLSMLYYVLSIMESKDVYVYFFNYWDTNRIKTLLQLFLICFTIYIIVKIVIKHMDDILVFSIITVFITTFILVIFFFRFLFASEDKYFHMYSDDHQHHIVIKEQAYLFLGYGDIYEEVSPGILKLLSTYGADDGYRPFTFNEYTVEWKEDTFVLQYCFGGIRCHGLEGYVSDEIPYAN